MHLKISPSCAAFLLLFLAASWLTFPAPSCADTLPSRVRTDLPASSSADTASLDEIHAKAEQGNATAQYTLGMMYSKGQGVMQNDIEAAKWFGEAAEQGDAEAQVNLGMMYYHGYGVPENYGEALTWLHKAAEQDSAKGQLLLGGMYFHGDGVTQDYAEAAKWFRKAAEQGDDGAQEALGGMYDHGYGVTQDYAEAARWIRKAAEQGDIHAQYTLGYMYYDGKGVARNYSESYTWFSAALASNKDPLGFIDRFLARILCYAIKYSLPTDQIADAQKRAGEVAKNASLPANSQTVTPTP